MDTVSRVRGFGKSTLASAVTGALCISTMTSAQQLEEVVVTAQKREQSLQEVPISVSAFSGEFIESTKMANAKQLALLTPGVYGNTDDSFLDTINIRGISTNDFGVGAEPSVGLYQDGVYLGRTGSAVTSFYDIERVEVIKGPQGTLFGRNASAGAISIITAKPEPEFGGKIRVGAGEDGYGELEGVINQPLSSKLYSRVAIYGIQEDGWVKNREDGKTIGDTDNTAGRVSLAYEDTGFTATLGLEYEDREGTPSVYRAFDPSGGEFPSWDVDASGNGTRSDVNTDKLTDEGNVFGATLNMDFDLGADYTLTSTTGYRSHDYNYREDFDGGPFHLDTYSQDQDGDYFSQELRLNYEGSGPLSWFVGASYYSEDLDAKLANTYDEDQMCATAWEAVYAPEYGYRDFVTNCDTFYAAYYGVYYGQDPSYYVGYFGPGVGTRNDIVDVEGDYEGWGIYGDATYSVTERLDVTVGARYTEDERDFALRFSESTIERNYFWWTVPFYTSEYVKDSKSWDNFSPRIAVNYALTEDVNVFANISRGYKAGGFNTFDLDIDCNAESVADYCTDGNIDYAALDTAFLEGDFDGDVSGASKPQSFDEEQVTNYEIGLKSFLLDRRMQFNASAFYYEYEDYQINYTNPDTNAIRVTNAGDAEAYGAEFDLRWLVTERLDIYFGLGWLDTELTKQAGDSNFCDGGPKACEGNPLPGAVEWTTSLVATYTVPLAGGNLFFTVENYYQDSAPGFGDFDDRARYYTDDYTLTNLRAGYDSDGDWSLSLWLDNASDEEYFYGRAAEEFNLGPHDFGYSRPRRFGVDFEYSF